MCGIAGVFGLGDVETVGAMCAALAHRGPDDQFVVSGDAFALGARRLAIVDLAGGRQPVANESETVWAVQNGELYNFPQVRPRLVADGHVLHTRCDTEILPHLYEQHGERLGEALDGMFAVAVWDDERRRGVLVRDRMGKKPLYYLRRGDALYFASEIKALLRVPGFERRLDLQALHHYLGYKHVPHPLTIFEGIRALPPAHALVFSPGAEPRLERYWRPAFGVEEDVDEAEAADRLLELLRAAVERRLMADVPIGFFLSGGIDSSLSTALAAELSPSPVKTFTLTYGGGSTTPGKEADRRWARWVAERYGTEHFEAEIAFERFPDSIGRILRCFDEPFAGAVSTYFLSELIAQHVKVAVAGDGADELFGSYLAHRLAQPLARHDEYLRTGDAALISPFEEQPELVASLAGLPEPDWRARLLVLSEEEKHGLYSPEVRRLTAGFDTRADLARLFGDLTARDPLNRVLEAEWTSFLPDQVLAFVDRLSMAHSLEVRSAYLDTAVVEFVASLPARLKIDGGQTKLLLKRVAERYFPEEMVWRRKEGFVMPVTDWLLADLEEYVRETLSASRLGAHGVFDAAAVGSLVDGFYREAGDYRYGNKILALVVFQEWFDLYMRGGS
jgi:asparagine synthase (glutamine-hydrolysing)